MVYDPSIGVFFQRDPVGYVDGMSVYQYVRGNPVCYKDSGGMSTFLDFSGLSNSVADAITGSNNTGSCEATISLSDLLNLNEGTLTIVSSNGTITYPTQPENKIEGWPIAALGTRPGTEQDFPWLPPGYDKSTWDFEPNENYDPSNKDARPGNFTDPEGNKWQYDPNRKKYHTRDHYDKEDGDGNNRERIGPDGKEVPIVLDPSTIHPVKPENIEPYVPSPPFVLPPPTPWYKDPVVYQAAGGAAALAGLFVLSRNPTVMVELSGKVSDVVTRVLGSDVAGKLGMAP